MRDRIRPPRDLEAVLDRLKEKDVFDTKQKGMMFAAAMGYAADKFAPPESYGEGIRLEYFANVGDASYIDALAVAHTGTLDVLAEERWEECLEIFEAYAAGGLAVIQLRLNKDKSRSELDVALDLLDEMRQSKTDRFGQLSGLL